ncbi:SDR family oxidoreductase [Halobacillus trueperi]|nr:SDR family oxidoreductase [Halobacillus trueperi]
MSNTYLFTGFPGYLASALIEGLFRNRNSIEKLYLLHLPSMEKEAKKQIEAWETVNGVNTGKIELVPGDITQKGLGLSSATSMQLLQEVTHVFHLAALYDLAVPLMPAWKVNVQGTREVNRWLSQCQHLERYIYFSTAYVSGKREGTVYEKDLAHGKGFKNHYEYTKHEAENLVHRMCKEIPTTIIRPGIVVGHTKSGVTAKFDGPYFILNLVEALRSLPVLPFFGKGTARVNLVPQDYVIEATNYLAHHPESSGKTYHLTDPNPYTAKEIYEQLSYVYADKHPRFTLPLGLANQSLKLRPLRKVLGIQREALDYFLCSAYYDNHQAEMDLAASGIFCPDFFSYTGALVDYYREKRGDPSKHVSIL